MFWKKKEKKVEPQPVPVVPTQKMVLVDLWYWDEVFPNVLQSWTWQTVDEAPEFPRARQWISAMEEHCKIHHWQIKEFDRPIPVYVPALVEPITPVEN